MKNISERVYLFIFYFFIIHINMADSNVQGEFENKSVSLECEITEYLKKNYPKLEIYSTSTTYNEKILFKLHSKNDTFNLTDFTNNITRTYGGNVIHNNEATNTFQSYDVYFPKSVSAEQGIAEARDTKGVIGQNLILVFIVFVIWFIFIGYPAFRPNT